MPIDANSILQRHEKLLGDRYPWMAFWQDVGNYVMPRKSEILSQRPYPDGSKESRLFDSTAIRANQILANGHMSWITPQGQAWFSFDAPESVAMNDEAKQWYAACTEIARRELARSNFYTEAHEFYLDRGGFGTACMYCAEGKQNPLHFEAWELGKYSLAEDDEGRIDTCFREFEMTLRQLEMKFGKEALSEDLQKKLSESNESKHYDSKITVVHAIFQRDPDDYDPRKKDGKNKPVASCYLEKATKHLISEGGFNELPFFASRFLHWSKSVYGWSPSWMALPESRQLNFLEKQMDALAEIAAFPRILLPEGFAGAVDLRAHGITYFDHNQANAIPKEWLTSGRYDIGKDRAEIRRKAIDQAFYVDVFQMFAQIERQMTAREVAERSAEKLDQFSPSFSRLTGEFLNPCLNRVFSILLRGGHFPPPPQQALQITAAGAFIPEPKVNYSSRIALAIKALETMGFERTLESWAPIIQARPDIMDNLDLDSAFRDMARNNNVPAHWLMDSRKMQEARAARAQQAQQQQQAEQAATMAGAAKDAGSIRPDSAVGQVLQKQVSKAV